MALFDGKQKHSETHSHVASELKQKGLRITPQRLMIISAVENSTDHISAEEIYSQVIQLFPNVNISTVYRTLDTLADMKLVTKTDLGDGRVRYHPAAKGHHHHLVCRECGAIIDLDEKALAGLTEMLLRDYNFIADLRHLGIPGKCINCGKTAVRKG